MSEPIMRSLVKKDLQYRSLSKTPVQALTIRNRTTRVKRGKKNSQFSEVRLARSILMFSVMKEFLC